MIDLPRSKKNVVVDVLDAISRIWYKFYVLRCLLRTFPVEVRHVYGFGLLHSSKSALLEISQNQERKKKEQIHIIICVVVSQETILF